MMIAVIADDITGAAEIAGISLRYGLRVGLGTGDSFSTDFDVFITCTDSRSSTKALALEKTEAVLKNLVGLRPALVYKKIDSVLRGYVLDELRLQMKRMGLQKAFILPANPTLGRTICKGVYYVQGVPIGQTSFASDPEFPIRQSSVQSILNDPEVQVTKHFKPLPKGGFVVGEAETREDLDAWAFTVDKSFVLAGAGDFFNALLQQRFEPLPIPTGHDLQQPLLYVSGTAFQPSVGYISRVHGQNPFVNYISKQMVVAGQANREWLEACSKALKTRGKAIVAFNSEWIPEGVTAGGLRLLMAKSVAALIQESNVGELFIEGGSTAIAILKELNISHLEPVIEWERGGVRMKAGDLYITVKPGSYGLPEEIKEQFGN